MSKKLILFSTRFIETKDNLFCDKNCSKDPTTDRYYSWCKSKKYLEFFLNDEMPSYINKYFNEQHLKSFFGDFKDPDGNAVVTESDSFDDIKERLTQLGRIKKDDSIVSFDKDDIDILFSYVKNATTLKDFKLVQESEDPFAKFDWKVDDNLRSEFFRTIISNNEKPINKGISLNTDFGGATNKITIDSRFKIYKLNTEDIKELNDVDVYGIWCLGKGKTGETYEKKWYEALYDELKGQLGEDEFNVVNNILFFLHDGDIDEKKPFEVRYYNSKCEAFPFLAKEQKLSVAIFDHSLSPIAKALRTPNIIEGIDFALKAMKSGGKRAFLNELSDCLARWSEKGEDGKTGKEEYEEKTEKEVIEKYEGLNLEYSSEKNNLDYACVEQIYKNVKKHIDELIEEEKAYYSKGKIREKDA